MVELVSYQLKDVSQTSYTEWRDNKALRAGPMTLEVFRMSFLGTFFTRDKKEDKVQEFINLRQGGMSVKEYYLKFTKFSKYAPSFVSNLRDDMSIFMMGVFENLVDECHSAVHHYNMGILV